MCSLTFKITTFRILIIFSWYHHDTTTFTFHRFFMLEYSVLLCVCFLFHLKGYILFCIYPQNISHSLLDFPHDLQQTIDGQQLKNLQCTPLLLSVLLMVDFMNISVREAFNRLDVTLGYFGGQSFSDLSDCGLMDSKLFKHCFVSLNFKPFCKAWWASTTLFLRFSENLLHSCHDTLLQTCCKDSSLINHCSWFFLKRHPLEQVP